MRKKIIVGNWKMNTIAREADTLVRDIVRDLHKKISPELTVVICPPFIHLDRTLQVLHADTSDIMLGAQNCSEYTSGAYTGEISAAMLKSLGVSYVIIGHSERRQYLGERGASLADKMRAALRAGLIPIYCCGEPEMVRERGRAQDFVNTQMEEVLSRIDKKFAKKLIIAYEPVWAIGAGRTATSQQIQDIHGGIRKYLARKFGRSTADAVPLLYGGSVTEKNTKTLLACSDVDGVLVGGASLQAKEFATIVQTVTI